MWFEWKELCVSHWCISIRLSVFRLVRIFTIISISAIQSLCFSINFDLVFNSFWIQNEESFWNYMKSNRFSTCHRGNLVKTIRYSFKRRRHLCKNFNKLSNRTCQSVIHLCFVYILHIFNMKIALNSIRPTNSLLKFSYKNRNFVIAIDTK